MFINIQKLQQMRMMERERKKVSSIIHFSFWHSSKAAYLQEFYEEIILYSSVDENEKKNQFNLHSSRCSIKKKEHVILMCERVKIYI
jgi:hypothetical protein